MKKEAILEIREFNRLYTGVLGLLDRHIIGSSYSLPEARVLYELGSNQPCTAKQLKDQIKIDKGYLSRMLKTFEKKGLIVTTTSKRDGREVIIKLSSKGEKAFASINLRSNNQINKIFSSLSDSQVNEFLIHMRAIKSIISKTIG